MQYLQFSIQNDIISSINLSKILKNNCLDLDCFKNFEGNKALIIGAGPSIEDPLIQRFIVDNKKCITIAADGATELCLKLNVIPDFVVTDLDGDIKSLVTAEKKGAILIVHSHGNNINRIKNLISKFTKVLGTTQVFPLYNIYNFGGFTDGDRSIFLADQFKIQKSFLTGMDFDLGIGYYSKKKNINPILKKKKLLIGKWLTEMLLKKSKTTFLNITTPKYQSSIYGIKNYDLL